MTRTVNPAVTSVPKLASVRPRFEADPGNTVEVSCQMLLADRAAARCTPNAICPDT
eukprot:CAMPEP_0172515528 /NCGR_PEP_ID=MMETSP1066-20121228/268695_1 /TAXON_ID=671091 /ORGANISM="Coscinodiscus wailesii, Strain CCMP2513" /LENGTH=55 /DNA_ID=CAMNT_0013296611 /DNA_START=25 /DNA_END=189 /DNA_ORIENTATION=+